MALTHAELATRREQVDSKQARCPICSCDDGFRSTGCAIAGGTILRCARCRCYFLSPPLVVAYENSTWSQMRLSEWRQDVERGRRYATAIADWHRRQTGAALTSILEVGCGSAFMGVGFAEAGIAYTGVDVDRSSVAFARSQGVDTFAIAAEELARSELRGERYDLILSSNTLEHVDDPQAAFRAMRQLQAAITVIIVPNPEGLILRLKANRLANAALRLANSDTRPMAYSIDGYWHNMAYSKQTMAYLCGEVGFSIAELRSISVNDPTFGFVASRKSLVYRLAAGALSAIDMNSLLLLVAK